MPKQRILILIASLLFVAYPCFAQLVPKPKEGYEIKDDKIYFRHKNAGVILEVATPESINQYFADRGSSVRDPFEGMGSDSQPLTVFIVSLLNRTNGDVTFTPSYVTVKIKTEAYFPMDFTVFLEFTEGFHASVIKTLQKAIFLQPEIVRPNEIVTRFLVYPALPKKFDELKLEFDYMFFESKELRPNFYFTRKAQAP